MKSKPKSISLWRSPTPRLDEFIKILDLLPNPAILYDIHREKVLAVNSKALRFTAYTRAEISHLKLNQLIPNLQIETILNNMLLPNTETKAEISIRGGQTVPISVQITALDPNNHWINFTFESLIQRQQNEAKNARQIKITSALKEISRAENITNRQDFLDFILTNGMVLTGSSIMAVYQVLKEKNDKENQCLIRIAVSENETCLPKEIIISDLSQVMEAGLWQPGKRISADLHRLARKCQFNYLASMPIFQNNEFLGILLAADLTNMPDDQILDYLQILTQTIGAHFHSLDVISEQNKENIEKSENTLLFNKTIDNVQDGVIFLSPELEIIGINPSAEQILGYSFQEVYKQPIHNVLIGAGNLDSALHNASDGIETPSLGNLNIHRRDGQSFAAHIQVIPVMKDKTLLRIVIICRDLSKHHEIRIRTQQLEQRALLGELTAIFAHEIRNPINNMSLALEFLDSELPNDDPNRVHIDRLKQNQDRLTHLMNTVLSFSKSTNYQMIPVDISSIIERVMIRWQPHMAREKVKTHLQKTPDLPKINGNAQALEQVFNNLFSNALRAMHETEGGILHTKIDTVTGVNSQILVQVTVSDTGLGIPKELIGKVFQP